MFQKLINLLLECFYADVNFDFCLYPSPQVVHFQQKSKEITEMKIVLKTEDSLFMDH